MMVKLKIKSYYSMVVCFLLVAVSIIIRIHDFKYNDFYNSDATWHVLHTLRCYEKTSVSIHKFLPIVTFDAAEDKFITWGATIPDQYGNYYYTSFSPAGFVAPYLFMKLLHIPISAMGLYTFNSILLILCFIFIARLFCKLFKTIDKKYVWLITAVIYPFQPEIMQGQGITYWSQSLYQLILLLQLNLLFSVYTRKNYFFMLFLCFSGAYTEWTGYCANIGIALFYLCTEEKKWPSIFMSMGVIVSTVVAFAIFCLHYLLVVDAKDFVLALISRFFARNVTTDVKLWRLGAGYVISFALLGLTTVCYSIIALLRRSGDYPPLLCASLEAHKWLFIVTAFALVENVIMKEHAIAYSFDRMKAVIPIIGLLFCSVESIMSFKRSLGSTIHCVLAVLSACAIVNLGCYRISNTRFFVFKQPQLAINQVVADSINEKFDKKNSIMVYEGHVRGYLNTLFDRGIYESRGIEQAVKLSANKGKKYALALSEDFSYIYYDLQDNRLFLGKYENGKVVITEIRK
jgi:hypothetical protein